MMRNAVLTLFLMITFAPAAIAQTGKTPTIEQSLSLKSAAGPRISPDGRYVAYQVQETNWEENAFENEIWIAVVATGERYQLTNAKKSSSGPQWSPDSKRIAFTSDRDGKRQIYLIAPAGGEAAQLTNAETGVNSFSWSPDGRRIAFTGAEPESKARKERKEKYGEFEVVKGDYTLTQLWMIEAPADAKDKKAEPQRLTGGSEFTVGGFSWSPDSTRIAFSATKDPDLGSSDTSDIYVLNVADKGIRKVVDTRGPDSNPIWSPDGRQIAFQTSNAREFFFYTNQYIAVVPSEGGTPALLTETFDEEPSPLVWSPDGIYFSSQQKTYSHLFRLNPATKAIERVSSPAELIASQFSFTRDFKQAAFVAAGANNYPEVYTCAVKSFEPRRLTVMGDQLKDFRLATREVIGWKSTDGTPIEGILIKPA
ncbi:MAG TPA: DPP IV N-terminal domain-containing protein, partial [Blastocatellia bacterium]